MASERQIAFALSLFDAAIGGGGTEAAAEAAEARLALAEALASMTTGQASRVIDDLMEAKRQAAFRRADERRGAFAENGAGVGYYRCADGVIRNVKESRSGNLYVMRFAPGEGEDGSNYVYEGSRGIDACTADAKMTDSDARRETRAILKALREGASAPSAVLEMVA